MNPQWIWIAVAAAVVLCSVLLIAAGARRNRSEYDRAVRERGSRTAGEQALVARAEEAKSFEIRPLTAAERDRYRDGWKRIQSHFVERPTATVVEADELIGDVMFTRGYPMADFEKYAALLSVKHPRVVEHYRAGHAAIEAGQPSTEDLRQAMLHYRTLFEELVGSGGTDVVREIAFTREVEPARDTARTTVVRDEDRPSR